jgi:hypothetical protein
VADRHENQLIDEPVTIRDAFVAYSYIQQKQDEKVGKSGSEDNIE